MVPSHGDRQEHLQKRNIKKLLKVGEQDRTLSEDPTELYMPNPRGLNFQCMKTKYKNAKGRPHIFFVCVWFGTGRRQEVKKPMHITMLSLSRSPQVSTGVVKVLTGHGKAFRGHEKAEGNLDQMLKRRSEADPVFCNWTEKRSQSAWTNDAAQWFGC